MKILQLLQLLYLETLVYFLVGIFILGISNTNDTNDTQNLPYIIQNKVNKNTISPVSLVSFEPLIDSVLMPCHLCKSTEKPLKWKDKDKNMYCDDCKKKIENLINRGDIVYQHLLKHL